MNLTAGCLAILENELTVEISGTPEIISHINSLSHNVGKNQCKLTNIITYTCLQRITWEKRQKRRKKLLGDTAQI
jgi:hypothetical protein